MVYFALVNNLDLQTLGRYSRAMKQNFFTQDQLKDEFDRFEERFGRKMDDKFTALKSDIFDKLDLIVGELEAARGDRELAAYQTRNHEEKLEDHEKRITALEEHR